MRDFFSMTRRELGYFGEQISRFIILQKTGLSSVPSKPFYGDLLLSNGLFVEVKTVRPNQDGTIRATVYKQGSQHLGHSNFILLQVILSNDLIDRYIIPSDIIKTKRIYVNHKLLPYKDAYHLLTASVPLSKAS